MAYPPHADSDAARWQRELEHLRYLNGQLRVSLEEARMAVNKANDEAAAYRDEATDLKNKIEVFWDSIEGARAMFVRSFPNYNTYRDSHKRSREVDERERLSRKSQRLEAPPTAGPSSRDRERERRPRSHEFPPETGGYPPEHEYRSHPRGQPHLTVPVPGSDKHAYNGRSPYDTHPPGPYPDPAHPHVDPTRGHSASPHLATRIPSHQGHRHAPSDASAYAEHQTHSRRESDPTLIPRQRRPANAEQATTRSSPSPSAPQQLPGVIDTNPNRPALPPAGAIIIHPPAAFQVSFTDLQPGIFLDRSDFGVEYPPNLDPPQGLQAVRCLFCDKHYSGANARSLWRRHVMGKHDFTMKGQRASTVRNRHMAQPSITSVPGDLTESAPPSAVPAASPVNPQPPASSRPPEVRPPRAPSPGHKRRPEGEHPESEDDQEAFDYQRHRRKPEPGPNGTGSPLTHAALESWTKGSGANSGGDVARWQGQGSVPGKSQAPDPKGDEEQTIGSPDANPGDKREWCLCRRPDSRDKMIRCDVPTCAIQWYHARCVGMTLEQVKAMKEWICEDCNRKTAQRRQEAHRDAPPADKERTPHTPEPPKDADVVMREEPNRPVEEPADDPARGAGRRRRVVPESESPNDGKRDGEADEAEPSEPAKPEGTPRKKGRKGNALAPSGGSTPQSEVVTTPGGTRRTRSGKPFYLEDGASASDGERQRSMETN